MSLKVVGSYPPFSPSEGFLVERDLPWLFTVLARLVAKAGFPNTGSVHRKVSIHSVVTDCRS